MFHNRLHLRLASFLSTKCRVTQLTRDRRSYSEQANLQTTLKKVAAEDSASLVISHNFSWFCTKDTPLLEHLIEKFSFIDHRYLHLPPRLRSRHWSGQVSFITRGGRFLTGILNEILAVLDEKSIQYSVHDTRKEDLANADKHCSRVHIDSNLLYSINDESISTRLHDYQVEIALLALREKRGILKCATGGGKTIVLTAILKALEHPQNLFPSVILFRNRSLVTQTYEVLRKHGIQNVGRVSMDNFEPNHITCSTIQSVNKISERIPSTKVLIVDEVHEFCSSPSLKIIQSFRSAVFRLGFSATPFKEEDEVHNYRLKSNFGPLLCDISTADLTSRNILAKAIVRFFPISKPQNIEKLDYHAAEEAGVIYNEYFHRTVAKIVNSIPQGRILIIVRRLAHGDQLAKLIPSCFWISGEDSIESRDYVLKHLKKSSEKKVIAIMSSIGNIGIDVCVHHLVNACGGRSPILTIQRIGRGLRRGTDKSVLQYYDFVHTTNPYLTKHAQARSETLKEEEHEIVIEQELPV